MSGGLLLTDDPEWRPSTKLCVNCRRTLPFYAFDKMPGSADGVSATCKVCTNKWEAGEEAREEALDSVKRPCSPGRRAGSLEYDEALRVDAAVEACKEPSGFCYVCGFFETHPYHEDTTLPQVVKWYCLDHYPGRAMRTCPNCGQVKPHIYYSQDHTTPTGRRRTCKSCSAAAARKYAKTQTPEQRLRRSEVRALHDAKMTPEQRERRNAKRRSKFANLTPEERKIKMARRRVGYPKTRTGKKRVPYGDRRIKSGKA